jgi:hypothetical protein
MGDDELIGSRGEAGEVAAQRFPDSAAIGPFAIGGSSVTAADGWVWPDGRNRVAETTVFERQALRTRRASKKASQNPGRTSL